jgi:hypothetical protein
MEVSVQCYASATGPPSKIPGIRFTGADPRAGLDGCGGQYDYTIMAVCIADLPLPNLIESAPVDGVMKHMNRWTFVPSPLCLLFYATY